MLWGSALGLIGAAVLYFAVTGRDPRTLLSPGGVDPAPTSYPTTVTPVPNPGGYTGSRSTGPTGGTAGVVAGIALVRGLVATMPGRTLQIISICRPGAIVAGTQSPSEHSACNAVDFRILNAAGGQDNAAMDRAYALLMAVPHCELCWNGRGGCTTSHSDHVHFAPAPCRTS